MLKITRALPAVFAFVCLALPLIASGQQQSAATSRYVNTGHLPWVVWQCPIRNPNPRSETIVGDFKSEHEAWEAARSLSEAHGAKVYVYVAGRRPNADPVSEDSRTLPSKTPSKGQPKRDVFAEEPDPKPDLAPQLPPLASDEEKDLVSLKFDEFNQLTQESRLKKQESALLDMLRQIADDVVAGKDTKKLEGEYREKRKAYEQARDRFLQKKKDMVSRATAIRGRMDRQKEESERLAREEREREQVKVAQAERALREKREAEARAQEERERLEQQRMARAEQQRREREAAERDRLDRQTRERQSAQSAPAPTRSARDALAGTTWKGPGTLVYRFLDNGNGEATNVQGTTKFTYSVTGSQVTYQDSYGTTGRGSFSNSGMRLDYYRNGQKITDYDFQRQ